MEVGTTFGKWTVIGGHNDHKYPSERSWWCRCACGACKCVSGRSMTKGKSTGCTSCGKKGVPTNKLGLDTEHYKRLSNIAKNAIMRCTNTSWPQYKDWGGRGIEVEFTSRRKFAEYLSTLEGANNPSLVLDRIDNDGNYRVGNLRFVTKTQSTRNRRNTRVVARF